MHDYRFKKAATWFAFGVAVLLAVKLLLLPVLFQAAMMAQGILVSFSGILLFWMMAKLFFRR